MAGAPSLRSKGGRTGRYHRPYIRPPSFAYGEGWGTHASSTVENVDPDIPIQRGYGWADANCSAKRAAILSSTERIGILCVAVPNDVQVQALVSCQFQESLQGWLLSVQAHIDSGALYPLQVLTIPEYL